MEGNKTQKNEPTNRSLWALLSYKANEIPVDIDLLPPILS